MEAYLDNSATTCVYQETADLVCDLMVNHYGNPSAMHQKGVEAEQYIRTAQETLAKILKVKEKEIFFTSGGTESDNWALVGTAMANKRTGNHIITSAIEHHALLDTVKWLGKNGYDYTVLPVDETGMADPKELEAAIRPDTILTSIMYANNEIGTIEPVAELGEVCRRHGVLFHTDGVQATGHIKIDVKELPIDMMTMAAHKMYGPKGVGALYVRKGIKLIPVIHGGGQEFGVRSGTENTPGLIGFGMAAELAANRLASGEIDNEIRLRDRLIGGLTERIPEITLTGHRTKRLPYHASICVKYVEGEGMLLLMDAAGIGVSSGSACTSGSLEPSYVLLALGLDHPTAHGSVRMTLSKDTNDEDIDYVLEKFPPIVEKLRYLSPFYKKNQ